MTSPRTLPLLAGLAGVGLLALSGCAVESSAAAPSTTTSTADTSGSPATTTPTATTTYADGTYTVDASYQAPSGIESITVELTVQGDVVTAASSKGTATDHEAVEWQQRFASGISTEVVGKDLTTLSVSRVAGASLTSNGFNTALDEIRSEAA